MAKSIGKQASNVFVWIILGLLFFALAGFGVTSFSGNSSRVAQVGNVEITAQDYALALQQEIRAQIQEARAPVSLRDLIADDIDDAVLQGLIARAALANESFVMGLSVGDAEVARQVRGISAFQGLDGEFDMEAYAFELAQNGLDIADFEEDLREDTARAMLQAAIVGGLSANAVFADTLVAFQGETRDFSVLTIVESDLPTGLPAPAEGELQAYYEVRPERFTRPEAKRISFAWITPAMLMDEMVIQEEDLRALYDDRLDRYVQPERRLMERLVFFEEADAIAALEAIAAEETSFDALVEERGLTLEDVDIGDVAEGDLPSDAAAAIFTETDQEIFGPFETNLGPAIYRVNAVLEASEISFEEAQEELRSELAADAARRAIVDMREIVDDLLAAGAELPELVDGTDLVLGSIDYAPGAEDGIAGYDAFRAAADAAELGDFPELLELSDGGIFAINLDEVVPPTLPPLAEIEDEVMDAWRATALREQLAARGETLVGQLATGATLEELGRVSEERLVRRQDFVPDQPITLVPQVFQLDEIGDVVLVPGADRAVIARLDAINPAARDEPDTEILLTLFNQQLSQSIAADVFEAYGQALQVEAGIEINEPVINAVHTQFP